MEALVEVVDSIPVINLCNCITVSEVPLDVVAEGLVGLLDDSCRFKAKYVDWRSSRI
jgi:hypothetical protein